MEVKEQGIFESSHDEILKTEPRTFSSKKRRGSSFPDKLEGTDLSSSEDETPIKLKGNKNGSLETEYREKVLHHISEDRCIFEKNKRTSSKSPKPDKVTSDIKAVFRLSQVEDIDKKVCALRRVIQKDSKAADITWSLFSAACNSYRYDSALRPYPQSYSSDNVKDIDALRTVAESVPALLVLFAHLQDIEKKFNNKVIELLYWVLVQHREPKLQFVPKEDHFDILAKVACKVPSAEPNHIFQVNYNSKSTSELKFKELASKYKTKFAFHGSRLDNFYSILHYGLQLSLNKVAAFGPGIYLSSELSVCLTYSPTGFSWGGSMFGSELSVIALCEMIDHPDVKCQSESGEKTARSIATGSENGPVPSKYYIVQNSDLVRVRYLLVYCSDKPKVQKSEFSVIGWIKEHKLVSAFIGYILFLFSVGLKNSPTVQRYYRHFFQNLRN